MASPEINRCFMRFEDRAERITAKQVAETFVSVGPLIDLLTSRNNQILYGRRGTGKTHALRFFQNLKNTEGDIAIYIDAQNIGSNGSIYNDPDLPTSERAVRLLVDICSAIHHELLDVFTDPNRGWELAEAAPLLDAFVSSFVEVRIHGATESEHSTKVGFAVKNNSSVGINMSALANATAGLGSENSESHEGSSRVKLVGNEKTWIDFNFFSKSIKQLTGFIGSTRLWILIDEWTTVPAEIQPYLADLIRRSMFSVPNISVKIAAIEHR
ncbi:ORC-CDC6 family AAA ATPase [Methylobacterium sp. Leaf399]|uniref:ORC-CDC6 family AAA ATPase n=1 Tax=Methylobacterium sp. Leaf399 TaxID=1736364 RepID=UPI000A66E24F|nr:hypothetical protein [Methylobacterium sp. Leaf399]